MPDASTDELTADLCILGAGIAGLNALFAASKYLTRDQTIVLVDRNAEAGGMWNGTYDYVRLHQPHPMFTAGNIAWTIGKEPSHLASRSEVLAHLRHCLAVVSQRVRVETRFGYEYRSHEESTGSEIVVECVPTQPGGKPLRVYAKKLIKAFGYDVHQNEPLALSSKAVRSVSPDTFDLLGEEMRSSNAPVYVIGGGKTGMDTAYTLITRYPGREVHLVIGEGTMFGSRDKLYPAGLRRYVGGVTGLSAFLDLAQRFDGHNETDVLAYFRKAYGVSLVAEPKRFMLGLLSERENETIAKGAHAVLSDYLADVVDDGPTTILRLKRSGEREIPKGTFFVNCTGYFHRREVPYEPYLSASGNVLSIQPRSAINPLTTHAAYLLPHLWYLGKLHKLPLYELDLFTLHARSRDVFSAAISPLALHNSSLMVPALPRQVLKEFRVDLMTWYPTPRRLVSGINFMRYLKQHPDHMRRTLDVVRDRFGIACGPLQAARA